MGNTYANDYVKKEFKNNNVRADDPGYRGDFLFLHG